MKPDETAADKVIQEKTQGTKASWELPENNQSANAAPATPNVPTNYEKTNKSYPDPVNFEVQKAPGRLG